LLNHLPDFGVAASVLMLFVAVSRFLVWMRMPMRMAVFMIVRMGMPMFMFMLVPMIFLIMGVGVIVFMSEVNIELDAGDARFLSALCVQVVALQMKLFQFMFEPVEIHTQIEQRANEHVAADAADEVEIKCLHGVQKG
jgi:hypothetical protein